MSPREIDAGHFSTDVVDFIRSMEDHRCRYIIVGGEAVIYYGFARLTGDVDFFYSLEPSNLERLHRALDKFWGGSIPGNISIRDLAEQGQIIQFGQPPNRIDLLNRIDGIEFDGAWGSHEEAELKLQKDALCVRYIGLKDLIQNKRAAGRPKDLDDLDFLTSI